MHCLQSLATSIGAECQPDSFLTPARVCDTAAQVTDPVVGEQRILHPDRHCAAAPTTSGTEIPTSFSGLVPNSWCAGRTGSAAVALPDDYLGEKICAAVVFRNKQITLTELNAYLDERGASAHARPDVLAPMPSLPTTAVGKVDKKQVVARLTPGT